jgi:predicted transcriptional regulator
MCHDKNIIKLGGELIATNLSKLRIRPTLDNIILVENVLKEDSIITIDELSKKTNIQMPILKEILDYLEQSNKIVISKKGISWIYNNNEKLQKVITEGFEL